jgi:hypothetical protein
MLIEFSVKNYKSLWKPQVLSMVAGGAIKDLQGLNTFEAPIKGELTLLKSAVMYGPNGAGKSNLISALDFMRRFVLDSSRLHQEGEAIQRYPFRLNSQGISEDTEFEVFFIQDDVRYQYGFACNDTRVTHEWLLAYPENRSQRWFERSYNPETSEDEWYFGSKLTGSKKTWKDNTRPNALFLSAAVQLNSEQLKPVFSWFRALAIIGHNKLIHPMFTIEKCQDDISKTSILAFMKGADIDVDDIDIIIKKIDAGELKLPEDMPDEFRKKVIADLGEKIMKRAEFIHKMTDSDKTVSFRLEEESDGTQKIFAYAGPWMDLLDTGRILVIDELDNSLHPHMIRFLLQLIHDPASNKANGQLIFSTHDTSILDPKILRRDQVWFVEKDPESATRMYSLSDFHPRKNEALEKGYLQGRYGALPYIGEVRY